MTIREAKSKLLSLSQTLEELGFHKRGYSPYYDGFLFVGTGGAILVRPTRDGFKARVIA